jgi:cell division protein FtsB
MGAKTKKKINPKSTFNKFFAIFVLTLSLFLMADLGRRAAANYTINQQAEGYRQQLAGVTAEHDRLEEELAYVRSDAYVEEIARTQLKWSRPGEKTVILVSEDPQQNIPTPAIELAAQAAQRPAENPGWLDWWFLFFDKEPPASLAPNLQ